MFSLRGSWFSHTPRRPCPPLGVEPLEQRLVPTAWVFPSLIIVTNSESSAVPANASPLDPGSTVSGQLGPAGQTIQYALTLPASGRLTLTSEPGPGSANAPHVVLRETDGTPLLDSMGGSSTAVLLQPRGPQTYLLTLEGMGGYQLSTTFDSFLPADGSQRLGRTSLIRSDDDNHPFRSALASAFAGNLNLGGGRLLSALSDLMEAPPTPTVPLGPALPLTSLMPVTVKPTSPPINPAISPSTAVSQGPLAYLPKRPLSGAALGFPAFNPAARKGAGKDRPSNFALSPFSQSGLDIVPVPVTPGLEERFADLLGDPATTTPGSGSTDADRDHAALRDTVLQMLQESGSFARPGLPSAEERPSLSAAEEAQADTTTDTLFSAGTPLDPTPEQEAEGPTSSPAARSMLALLAAGACLADQQQNSSRRAARSETRHG